MERGGEEFQFRDQSVSDEEDCRAMRGPIFIFKFRWLSIVRTLITSYP